MTSVHTVGFAVLALAAGWVGFQIGEAGETDAGGVAKMGAEAGEGRGRWRGDDPAFSPEVILDGGDLRARTGRFLAALGQAGVPELIALLKYVVIAQGGPEEVSGFYSEAIVKRIVALGGVEALLANKELKGAARDKVLGVVVAALGESDPAAAETLVLGLAGRERGLAMEALAKELGEHHPARGVAFIQAHAEADNSRVGYFFFHAWAEKDPRAAAEAGLKLRDEENRKDYYSTALGAWAQAAPEAAWTWLQSLPGNLKSNAMSYYLTGVLQRSTEDAVDALLAHPELGGERTVSQVGRNLGVDPEAAQAQLDRIPLGRTRTALIRGMAENFAGDAQAGLAWMETLLPGERDEAVTMLIDHFAQDDPGEALDLAAKGLAGPMREKGIAAAVAGWARRDFDGALAAVMDRVELSARSGALKSLFGTRSHFTDRSYAERLGMIPEVEPTVRAQVVQGLAKQWAGDEPEAVEKALASLAPRDQAAFAEGLLEGADLTEGKQTEAWARYLSPEQQADKAWLIGRRIAESDPRAAAEFVSRLPERAGSGRKANGMREILDGWAFVAPAEATAFVRAMPAGGTREQTLQILSSKLRQFDLEAATRVISDVSEPEVRETMLREMAWEWAQTDPARGRALIVPLIRTDAERAHAERLLPAP